MKREDIEHLAELARIKLTPTEVDGFSSEIGSILEYVSVVQKLTIGQDDTLPLTPRYNVFRDDVVTNEPGVYAEAILEAMPHKKGRHLLVKKILNHD